MPRTASFPQCYHVTTRHTPESGRRGPRPDFRIRSSPSEDGHRTRSFCYELLLLPLEHPVAYITTVEVPA